MNKTRAQEGEARTSSRSSASTPSPSRRGGLRSHKGPGGRTYRQLYDDAKRQHLAGRSKMSKAELERHLSR